MSNNKDTLLSGQNRRARGRASGSGVKSALGTHPPEARQFSGSVFALGRPPRTLSPVARRILESVSGRRITEETLEFLGLYDRVQAFDAARQSGAMPEPEKPPAEARPKVRSVLHDLGD